MILSVSRRTDIPAFYSQWFIERIKAGFVYVRNPYNFHLVNKVIITPDSIDTIVFWTKYPEKLIRGLKFLNEYKYYFLYTITGYGADLERGVPQLEKTIITFRKLSDKIGSEKVIWRYDPIIFTDKFNLKYHEKQFENISRKLSGFTNKCIISFLTYYKKTIKNMKNINYSIPDLKAKTKIIKNISDIGRNYKIKIETCCENSDFRQFNVEHASCIDKILIEKITGKTLKIKKDKNQRKYCGCAESVDIGAYNTCLFDCKYCYANYNRRRVLANYLRHRVNQPLLYGKIGEKDKIYIKNG